MSEGLPATLGRLEVVVCCGSGGVGKTTISAALAMAITARYDKRVLVLTIDPARRLATALGIGKLGVDPVVVPKMRLHKAGATPKGELSAAMLDMKTVWDRMVYRYAPSVDVAGKIVGNKFYQGISEAFVGSHEFMAMEALYELHSDREYDCIVVDTPPSRNALDFLEAPTRFNDFAGAKLLSWLAGGSRFGFRAMNFAARPFLSIADRLVGSDVLDELAEFVKHVQLLQGSVQRHANEIYRLMRSPAVGFVVVTTLEPAAYREAEFFATKLREFSMPLRALVVNRVLPDFLRDADAAQAATTLGTDDGIAAWLTHLLGEHVSSETLAPIGELFLAYHRIATRDARQLSRLAALGEVPVASVPLIAGDVSGLEALAHIGAAF